MDPLHPEQPTASRTCLRCGLRFYAKPSKKTLYCSRACYKGTQLQLAEARGARRVCIECGKAFVPSFTGDGPRSLFCTQECADSFAEDPQPRQLPLFPLKRRCRVCGETKPVDAFRPQRNDCRACNRESARQYAAERPAQTKARHARYRHDHAEELQAYQRAWFAAHPGYLENHNRAYRASHLDQIKTNERMRRRLYPERHRAHIHRREARLAGVGGSWTAEQWLALKRRYGHTCLMCGQKEPAIDLTFDHVIPISCGGPNTIENAQPLCLSCNSRKGNRTLDLRPLWHEAEHD